jgi:hypothetical protein
MGTQGVRGRTRETRPERLIIPAVRANRQAAQPRRLGTIHRMCTRTFTTLAFAALCAVAAAPAAAQTLSPDEKELAAYTLTMPTVRKVAAIMQRLNELEAQKPRVKELAKLRAEIETLEAKDELTEAEQERLEKLRERAEVLDQEIEREGDTGPGNANTIDDMVKRIESLPEARAALASHGLSGRDFAKTLFALLQAALVKGFSQGKVDMARLPPGVNPANVRFVEENATELAALQITMSGKKQ